MSSKQFAAILLLILGTLILLGSVYRIQETEKAVRLRFGALISEEINPGLHFKIPIIDTIRIFDARVLTVDANPESFYTIQKKRLIVDSFVKWRVVNVGDCVLVNLSNGKYIILLPC